MRKKTLEEAGAGWTRPRRTYAGRGSLAGWAGTISPAFWAQQVAAKGYLYAQGEAVLGHSVERLCDAAAAFDAAFGRKRGDVVRSGRLLHSDAYPNTVPDSIPTGVYTEGAAREAVGMASEGGRSSRSCTPRAVGAQQYLHPHHRVVGRGSAQCVLGLLFHGAEGEAVHQIAEEVR